MAARLGKVLGKMVVTKDSTMNGFRSLERYPSGRKLQQMIIANSSFIAMTRVIEENLVRAGVPREKIYQIPNGIEISANVERTNSDSYLQNVLFVGNLYQQPAKGIDILLKAWYLIAEKYPKASLQVIGDGVIPAYRDFANKLGISGSVQFSGKQADLEKYYRWASLFVLPSRREGMSNALMEAMMLGLPCLASDISGNQDLIQNGVNGLLVPAMDIESLAKGICYIFSHPEEALIMGRRARETIVQQVDIRIIADKYILLYKNLLGVK